MTFQQFLEKYNGKYVEVAGSTGAENQCVDLANAYIRDVWQLPIIAWTNARDFPDKLKDVCDWIPNSPTGVPQEGDLIIWQHNQYGHIAIFIEGDINSFRSFDQNYPTGTPAHVQNHNYNNPPVAGWLRKRGSVTVDLQAIIDELRKARDDNWNLHVADQAKISELEKRIQELQVQLQSVREAFEKQTEADANLGAELIQVSQDRDALKTIVASVSDALQCDRTLSSMLTAVDSLKTASDDIACHAEKDLIPIVDNSTTKEKQKERIGFWKGFVEWLFSHIR